MGRSQELLFKARLVERLDAVVSKAPAIPPKAGGNLSSNEIEVAIMHQASCASDAVLGAVKRGLFPVVIGGDHTSAFGLHTVLAVAFGETGIVWIDTHPVPQYTPIFVVARITG